MRRDCHDRRTLGAMIRCIGRMVVLVLAAGIAEAHAQSPSSTPAAPSDPGTTDRPASTRAPPQPPSADDICRAVEEDAAANGLPVEFFARVIWQESRFNVQPASP